MNSVERPVFLERNDAPRVFEEYRRVALGGFLKQRRAQSAPDPAWPVVDQHAVRRVNGMRREELAWAADVSVDYYTKLEQGRAHNPSGAVVTSLADALDLNRVQRRYLAALTADPAAEAGADRQDERVDAEARLRDVGERLTNVVMYHLLSEDLFLRDLTEQATAVLFDGGRAPEYSGENVSLVTYVFAEPESRRVYVDWSQKAREVVGLVHMAMANGKISEELLGVLGNVWHSSSAFRYLWARYDPREKDSGLWRLRLANEGVVSCRFTTMQAVGNDTVSLVVYDRARDHAE